MRHLLCDNGGLYAVDPSIPHRADSYTECKCWRYHLRARGYARPDEEMEWDEGKC
jgi:hypothetical protein